LPARDSQGKERERERERQRDARRDKAPISARVIALREYLSDPSSKGGLVGIHQIDENDRRTCARKRGHSSLLRLAAPLRFARYRDATRLCRGTQQRKVRTVSVTVTAYRSIEISDKRFDPLAATCVAEFGRECVGATSAESEEAFTN